MATKQRTYKQIKEELDEVLIELQRDDIDIDDVVKLYKKGQELITEMETYIKQAENTVKDLKVKFKKH